MRRFSGWTTAMCLVVTAWMGSVGTGCAQDVGDVDRTQPEKVKKSLFQSDDEWYYRQTVIDTDRQGSGIFEGLESPLKRIRWEVTQDYLYAYSTVPLAEGIEDENTSEDDRQLGVVAAYPISEHFDVQRDYNASTGEQTNVIVENSSDRPWYEREYMRVDWSTNDVSGQGNLAPYFGVLDAVSERVPESDNEVNPDRLRLSKDYIDFTNRYRFEPDILACAYNVGALEAARACEGGKVRVRSSFVRIDPDAKKDYEPFMLTDDRTIDEDGDDSTKGALYTATLYDPDSGFYFDAQCNNFTKGFLRDEYGNVGDRCQPAKFDLFSRFGFFRTERISWNEQYPNRNSDRLHYANRWDIWADDFDDDGNQKPFADRTPKPIVYHLNAEYPKDMIPAAREVERQWNQTFLETVRVAQGLDTKADVEKELKEQYGDSRMFRLEQNSCMPGPLAKWKAKFGASRSSDRRDVQSIFDEFVPQAGGDLTGALWSVPKQDRVQLCAELEAATANRSADQGAFTWERVGDLRYSFFNWVDEFNGSWSGYGPSASDPLTGEIISGNANFSGTPLRRYATSGTDIVQYINGDLSNQDIRTGEYVRKYLARVRQDSRQQPLEATVPPAAQRELARRTGYDPSQISPTNFEGAPPLAEQDFIKKWGKDRIMREANRLSETMTNAAKSDTRLTEFYDQPRVQELMMRDADFSMAVNALANGYFGPDPDKNEIHQAYLDLATPRDTLKRNRRFEHKLAEKNIFASRNLQRGLTGLVTYDGVAEAYKDMPREKIRRYLMDNAFIGTMLHEMGHTFGLRHNFQASMDALNYHDGFWKIRRDVANGTLQNGNGVTIRPSGTVIIDNPDLAKKYSDSENADYVNTAEMRLGSIMDYTGDMTGRFAGLGKYDKSAIMFAYGERVQQWKKDVTLPNLLWYQEWTHDYTDLPAIYADRAGSQDPQAVVDGVNTILNDREWVPLEEAVDQRRSGIKDNTSDFKDGKLSRNNHPYIDRTVPYDFCTDDRRDSQLGCDVFDWGANQTEVVNHAFDTYRFFQPFWRYMGQDNDRLQSNYRSYIGRVQRALSTAARPFRYYSIYQWSDLGAYTEDLERASIDALNFYAEILATPRPNRYCMFDQSKSNVTSASIPLDTWYYDLDGAFVPNGWDQDETNCSNWIDVKRGEGQFYGFDLTDEYDYRIRRVGSYVDKSLATQAMFNISANYAFSSFFTDARATNISFWTLFEDQMQSYLRGVILGDFSGFSGRHDAQKGYQPPKVVDLDSFGTGRDGSQPTSRRIYTPISFNQEFSTLVGGMLSNSGWQDRSVNFSNYVKVAVTNDELQPFPQATDVAVLEHPLTHQLYQAPQIAGGDSITYDLVMHAKDIKQKWADAKANLAQAQADLDAGTIDEDAYERAWDDERGYEDAFEDSVAKLEMIRFIFDAGNVLR